MLKLFQKDKFPTKLFIIISLADFIILSFIFLFLRANLNYTNTSSGQVVNYKNYFNKDYNNDPLITRVPSLKDIISKPIINDIDPSLGLIEAPIVIVEFFDYKCGYCREQEIIFERIAEKYKDKIRLILKDYPEENVNSESFLAAIAARCADEQGKFWQYHGLLYENSDNLNKDIFISLAKDVNLREKLFKECLGDKEIAQLIKNNILEARALDIKGVPFIYINNQEVMGQITQEDLERIVEIELSN